MSEATSSLIIRLGGGDVRSCLKLDNKVGGGGGENVSKSSEAGFEKLF